MPPDDITQQTVSQTQASSPAAKVPGEDVLYQTLNHPKSNLTNVQRRQIWDAYHTPGDRNAFIHALDQLELDGDVKRTIYNMRFEGFTNQGTQQTPAPQAPTVAQPPTTHTSPLAPGSYQGRKGGPVIDPNQTVPHTLVTGMSDVIEGGLRDVGKGIQKGDPRQVASGAGQLFGILAQGEAGKESAKGLIASATEERGPSVGGSDPLSQAPGTSRGPVFKAIKELRARGFSNAE